MKIYTESIFFFIEFLIKLTDKIKFFFYYKNVIRAKISIYKVLHIVYVQQAHLGFYS